MPPTQPTKLQRWLDLIAYLSGRHVPVPVEEVWANVPAYASGLEGDETVKQSARRMFERDKDELKESGIPIETVTYHINYGREEAVGYRLATKNFHLPYLRLVAESQEGVRPSGATGREFELTEKEASAALDGLQELASVPSLPLASFARSAFRKLSFDLDPELLRDSPVHYAEDPETTATRDALQALSDAVRRRKQVRFRYHGMTRDTDEERSVHPYGLLFQHGRWYLVGHDLDREALRMFRLGRMSDLRPNRAAPGTADYEVPADFDLAEHVGRRAWELGADVDAATSATVRFRFPRSLWAERNGHGELVREEEDGAQIRRFEVRRRDPFLRWLLSLGGDAWVERPEELREEFRALAAEVARRYGGTLRE
jgi:proteasome accessory factor B